ncbi:hypothetical protein AAG906_034800 [Vitis piasezkii]
MSSSTVISIPNGHGVAPQERKPRFSFPSISSFLREKGQYDSIKLIHSIKVGISLVLVSLLYLLKPLYDQVGENAMWAIMTVVVVFEFFVGATLSKGVNRGIGTVIGGGFGLATAVIAEDAGEMGNAIGVAIAVFLCGTAATYVRLLPSIKKTCDYGVMIFLLTFNLVAVSGIRGETVVQLARARLSTIGIGFGVCVFTSLCIHPMWASDELHNSVASRFEALACSIDGCLGEYFKLVEEKENQTGGVNFSGCQSVLDSTDKDDMLAKFARWEPWHGKFGFSHPWEKYLDIGKELREAAATIFSLKGCLQSPRQPSSTLRQSMREQCEELGSSLASSLRELGDSIKTMRKCRPRFLIVSKLQSKSEELNLLVSPSKLGALKNDDGLAIASFVFQLMDIVGQIEVLAKKVEELGELAKFETK